MIPKPGINSALRYVRRRPGRKPGRNWTGRAVFVLLLFSVAAPVAAADKKPLKLITDAVIQPAPFPIEVRGDLGDLDIAIEAGYTGIDAYLKLHNRGSRAATCETEFVNGPESVRRSRDIAAEETAILLPGLRRKVVRLRIQVHCRAPQ